MKNHSKVLAVRFDSFKLLNLGILLFQDAKHQMLFLVEMLEPYLDPAITPVQSIIAFGNVSSVFLEKQEKNCAIALNVIRIAVQKSAVLPSLEAEWRRRSVAPR